MTDERRAAYVKCVLALACLALLASVLVSAPVASGAPSLTVLTPKATGCTAEGSPCLRVDRPKVRCTRTACALSVRVRSTRSGQLRVWSDGILRRARVMRGTSRPVVRVPARTKAIRVQVVLRSVNSVRYAVPRTTRLYRSGAIVAVAPGPKAGQARVTLGSGQKPPVPGGHLALGPSAGLPDGMFARVVSVGRANGRTQAVVERTSVDQVLDDVRVDFEGDVTPKVVNEAGLVISERRGSDAVLNLQGSFAGTRGSHALGAFECKESGGVPRSEDDVWKRTGSLFPISVTLENTHTVHRFDAGSVLPPRAPFLLVQFSGEAVAKIGFQAKTGFKCALSAQFRRTHRIQIPIGSIGPVPVNIYLEPSLEFEVSAAGEVDLSQRHYFAITLQKQGSGDLQLRRAHSADPVRLSAQAEVKASLFAGGDLSLMVGGNAGAVGLQAGIYGAFGPEFALTTSNSRPGCLTATARLRANLGVRLEAWVKRWNLEIASLSTSPAVLASLCGLQGPPGPQPAPAVPAQAQISAGTSHTCGVRADGRVLCWGDNYHGELGLGDTTNRTVPTAVPGLADVRSVSAGGDTTCALARDGTVSCWGDNFRGQVGDGTVNNERATPGRVVGLSDVAALSTGPLHSCVIRNDRTVACWGMGSLGEMGDGAATVDNPVPVAVPGLDQVTSISAGLSHTCAVRSDGSVFCWGDNSEGAIGDGTHTRRLSPTGVPGLTDAVVVNAGYGHTCALRMGGSVVCWGRNGEGQLGNGTFTEATLPTPVVGLGPASAISTEGTGGCAIMGSGSVWCWGFNESGALGDGTAVESRPTPGPVAGLSDVSSISGGGGAHVCVLRRASPAACWGFNRQGQIGDGSTDQRPFPVSIPFP